jgi:hypothetical protein
VAAWHAGELKAADIEIIQDGFKLPDGRKVKDTNELALCSEEVTTSDEVREAFTAWDFCGAKHDEETSIKTQRESREERRERGCV